jgi:hypothetical protein
MKSWTASRPRYPQNDENPVFDLERCLQEFHNSPPCSPIVVAGDERARQAELCDDLKTTSHRMAAATFLKASTNLMMISESFALLRALFLNPRYGGSGLTRFSSDDANKRVSSQRCVRYAVSQV